MTGPDFNRVETRRLYGYTTALSAGRYAVRCYGELVGYGDDPPQCEAMMLRHWESTHVLVGFGGQDKTQAALREASEMLHKIMTGGSYNALEFIERLARIDAALKAVQS